MAAARLALEVDGVRLEVDPNVGGRVTSLRRGDVEVLSGPVVDADNYGSTFWTSPQSGWGWPPPAEIDRGPYAVDEATADAIRLTSAPDHTLGVRVTKRFSTDLARQCFAIEYAIENVSRTSKTYAPWEVTRVRSGGLTLFPARVPPTGALHLDEATGATWFAHDSGALPVAGLKAFAASQKGWLAHAGVGLLYVKRFDEVPHDMQAPGEAEIEIYANTRYVELEVQGRYARIAPGDCASWTVSWYVREIPRGIALTAGNAALLAFTDAALRGPG